MQLGNFDHPITRFPDYPIFPVSVSVPSSRAPGRAFIFSGVSTHRLLNAHPEQLIVTFLALLSSSAPSSRSSAAFMTSAGANRGSTLVIIGASRRASLIASRASFSVTPSISNSTRPGRITATTGPKCALAHTGFLRFLGNRLVWKHARPVPRATQRRHRDARRFNSAGRSASGSSAFNP